MSQIHRNTNHNTIYYKKGLGVLYDKSTAIHIVCNKNLREINNHQDFVKLPKKKKKLSARHINHKVTVKISLWWNYNVSFKQSCDQQRLFKAIIKLGKYKVVMDRSLTTITNTHLRCSGAHPHWTPATAHSTSALMFRIAISTSTKNWNTILIWSTYREKAERVCK